LAGAGVTTGTINYSTGAYSVTFDAAPALNTPVVVTADSGQLLVNNFLYFAGSGSVTSILGCSTECQNSDNLTSSNGTGKPAIFTTSLDSTTGGSAGPLATGAMKIDIVENDTSSDGYPELVVKLSGMTGSSKLTLTLSQPAIKNLTVGSKYRTSAVVKISAGPNGHLYGLESSNLISRCQSGASFTPVGEAASISTYHSGQFNLGNTGNPYSDNDIAGGELRLPLLSPACDTTGMTSPTGAFSLVLGAPANTPISATIRLSRFSFKAYSY
jgi:hypothetical protein